MAMTTEPPTPEVLLRLPEVSKRLGLKRSAIYERISNSTLPAPIKLSPQVSVWPASEIDACIKALIRGASAADMQALIGRLEDARATA